MRLARPPQTVGLGVESGDQGSTVLRKEAAIDADHAQVVDRVVLPRASRCRARSVSGSIVASRIARARERRTCSGSRRAIVGKSEVEPGAMTSVLVISLAIS